MRFAAVPAAILVIALLGGCGGDSTTVVPSSPTRANLEVTPAGTGDEFLMVGPTGIFVNSAPAAVQTPTLLEFTRFPTPSGLVAPVPKGFGFVGAASIQPVQPDREGTVLAAPVILRIPPVRPLPQGRRLQVMIANDTDRVPVFTPLLASDGQPVTAQVASDGSLEFETTRFGTFLVAE